MLIKLYFLRHGLADWPNWDKADEERPLTAEGVRKMKAEAKAMERLDLALDHILSSPLVRARQTAEAVSDRLGLAVIETPTLAPGFTVRQLRDLLRQYPEAKAIMLVGHEPDFSTTIAQLIGGGRVAVKKGGLARVDLDSLDPLRGELIWLIAPAVLMD